MKTEEINKNYNKQMYKCTMNIVDVTALVLNNGIVVAVI